MSEMGVGDKEFIFFIVTPISISYYPNCQFKYVLSPFLY
jgi:hypothetical protein